MPAWTEINQLNGVVFANGDILKGSGVPFDPSNTGDKVVTVADGNAVPLSQTTYGGDTATVRIINTRYIAPRTATRPDAYGNFVYTPPVFGRIALDGLTAAGDPPYTPTFHIRGFTSEGLLLSAYDPATGAPRTLPNFTTQGRYLILSNDGFGPAGVQFPVTFSYDPTVFDLSTLCFAEGTRLATPEGMRAVEMLAEGDLVLTASGATRAVRWVGHLVARPAQHPRPQEVQPVRVSAHAFAPGVPAADVRLSPGHAVHVDGVLVPVGHLVNDATIVQETVARVRYFHVELEAHDVLLAEGLPCESYLDDGNRAAFANPGEPIELRGRLDPRNWEAACAAMVAAGPQLTAIRERLHARAEELGWQRSDAPDLRLIVNGAELAPVHAAGGRFWFRVPPAPVVTLRSAAGVLSHVMPGCEDARRLGVAVAQVRVDGVALPLDAAAFGDGFHATERHGEQAWRWTDGAAVLALDGAAATMIEIVVSMTAPTWQRPAPALRAIA